MFGMLTQLKIFGAPGPECIENTVSMPVDEEKWRKIND